MKVLDQNGFNIQWCCDEARESFPRGISYNVLNHTFTMFKTCSQSDQSLGVHEAMVIRWCPFCRRECRPFMDKKKKKFKRLL